MLVTIFNNMYLINICQITALSVSGYDKQDRQLSTVFGDLSSGTDNI